MTTTWSALLNDTQTDKLLVLTPSDLRFLPPLFAHTQDVVVDADANVYVADTGNHRIRRISPEVRRVQAWLHAFPLRPVARIRR